MWSRQGRCRIARQPVQQMQLWTTQCQQSKRSLCSTVCCASPQPPSPVKLIRIYGERYFSGVSWFTHGYWKSTTSVGWTLYPVTGASSHHDIEASSRCVRQGISPHPTGSADDYSG